MKAVSAVVDTDQKQAVSELRTLRAKAESSALDIGKALLDWQRKLEDRRFQSAYFAAGWTTNQVYYYLSFTKNQQDTVLETKPEVVDDSYQTVENNTPPVEVSFPEDSPWQPSLPTPRNFAQIVQAGQLPDLSHTFMSLLSYATALKAYELEMQSSDDDEKRSQLAVLWLRLKTQLYKKEN